ncbi:conserved protein, unknown function [Plasmodium falciparum 3D7]|uniref:DUF4200 domain-containing protein n=2 Tax=Plasmodium falciparum TaxID=5833 RepID=Q8IJG9_PLAF7|nr:conserved protein, unknown function [Plasmodium falciparum 3D7]PKC43391.1 hypothetical protein CK202_4605 [Plasmodium falciparum NF54]CZT98491.1 conserved protein, unknown function [Plasmodium falciparum 3D7]|eukprot:XP_001347513.2 conserved Plasmodium protein, unknown function [Plasmodium falciparum 3D7]
MSEDDFYNNLENFIEESKKRIIEKEKLITSENDEEIDNIKDETQEIQAYNYTSLMIPSDVSSENNSDTNENIKQVLNLQESIDIQKIKEKKEKKKKQEVFKDIMCSDIKYEKKIKRKKKKIFENKRSSKKNKNNIRDFINLEKDIIITKTLMYNKKKKLDDIYKYTSKKEKTINNLNKNMIKEAAHMQELLIENFKKTEDLIKKFEDISSKKKKKKNQVQSLNIEISKLEVELEKKEEKIKELDKYKFFLNKLANCEKSDDTESTEKKKKYIDDNDDDKNEQSTINDMNKNIKEEDTIFSKKMKKYINNSQLLIDNFNLLEEKHLQLIDDTQNAEYELEEYEKKYEDKKKAYDIKYKEIDKKIENINNFINEHNNKIIEYEILMKNKTDHISFNNINNKIDFICTQFSYDIINTNEIMKKLQLLENKIYSYITTLTKYTEENSQLVYEYQREREQERRKQMRFEINLDRKGNNQNKQLMNKKVNNKNFNTNPKDKKEKRENIYTIFEKNLFK